MPSYKIYNGGRLVSVNLEVDDIQRGDDAVEKLIEQIKQASENLKDIFFEVESKETNHGDSRTHTLVIHGTPQGELAKAAVDTFAKDYGLLMHEDQSPSNNPMWRDK